MWIYALLTTVLLSVIPYGAQRIWDLIGHGYISGLTAADLLARLLGWVAAYMLTRPNPATIASQGRWGLRRTVRLLIVLAVAIEVLAWVSWLVFTTERNPLQPLLALLKTGTHAALFLCLLAYTRGLCDRLPDEKLDTRLELVFWGFAAYWCLGVIQTGIWGFVLSPGHHPRRSDWYTLYAALLAGKLLLPIFSIWLVFLLRRFGREVRKIAAPEV
jgi:hypothetical protein